MFFSQDRNLHELLHSKWSKLSLGRKHSSETPAGSLQQVIFVSMDEFPGLRTYWCSAGADPSRGGGTAQWRRRSRWQRGIPAGSGTAASRAAAPPAPRPPRCRAPTAAPGTTLGKIKHRHEHSMLFLWECSKASLRYTHKSGQIPGKMMNNYKCSCWHKFSVCYLEQKSIPIQTLFETA